MTKLFEHQKEGVLFLLQPNRDNIKGKMLLCDQGTGKSRIAVVAACEKSGKKLIICPASLKLNWKQEIQMVFPDAKIYVANSADFSKREMNKAEWVIVNYDILGKLNAELYSVDWAVCIMDECQFVKSSTSLRSKSLFGQKRGQKFLPLVDKFHDIYMLSGTPLNRPIDFYNQLRVINHPIVKNYKWYATRYCRGKKSQFGWDYKGARNMDELHKKISRSVFRRTKNECLDLPDKIRRFIPVEVDLKQYHKYFDDFLNEKKKTRKNMGAVQFMKLQQSLAILKTKHTIELTEESLDNEESVIIFTCFTEVVERLEERFKGDCVKVVGGMTPEQKDEAVKAFQSGKKRVFIGNIKAAGVGLTLTKSTHAIFNDFSHTLTDHLQSEDRHYRIGQKNNVLVTYLVTDGTIDEKIKPLLSSKAEAISQIMDGKKVKDSEYLNDLWELLND